MPCPPSPLALPVPRSATALMQLLQLLVGREGHRHWCGGTLPPEKLAAFAAKMAARYPILRNARQRAYDRKRGRAVVHFVAFPAGGQVHWWLLSDAGVGGLADAASPDAHVSRDAMSADGHVTYADYVLLYATKNAPHAVLDKKTGRSRQRWRHTSSWTWRMQGRVVSEVRASIDRCCVALEYGAEAADGRPGWGLRELLAAQRRRPLFAGVRSQVIELHRYARDQWAPRRPVWLARHPELARRYGKAAGALLPLQEVVANRLPLMRRLKIYDEPRQTLADLVATPHTAAR